MCPRGYQVFPEAKALKDRKGFQDMYIQKIQKETEETLVSEEFLEKKVQMGYQENPGWRVQEVQRVNRSVHPVFKYGCTLFILYFFKCTGKYLEVSTNSDIMQGHMIQQLCRNEVDLGLVSAKWKTPWKPFVTALSFMLEKRWDLNKIN